MPQVGLGVMTWLLQAPCWLGRTGPATTGPMLALGYWPGCYSPQDSLGLLVWLLQAPGWPEGYWPGCFRPQVGLRCTGLVATGRRLAWGTDLSAAFRRGYRPCCYSPQDSLGVLAWLLQAPGWPRGTGLAATSSRLA